MNPLDGILRAARTLSYYGRRQEVTANNLANVNTAGFKMDRITAQRPSDLTHPIPVEAMDLSQGALRMTGRPLDVALEGDGFLVLETEHGERLGRGGSLRLDGAGQLVAEDGVPVVGDNGPIVVTGSAVTIDPEGQVSSDGQVVDRLRLVRPSEDAVLVKEGAGRFRLQQGELVEVPELRVRQGHLEEPNIDSVGGMISLVTIQRAYGSAATALKTMDGVLGSVTTDVARL
jgi:flagellar basal-body rod protein FlgF